MLNANELRAAWVRKGMTQEEVAKSLNVSRKTLSTKMKKGIFGSDEIEKLISLLDIDDPMSVFFAREVT